MATEGPDQVAWGCLVIPLGIGALVLTFAGPSPLVWLFRGAGLVFLGCLVVFGRVHTRQAVLDGAMTGGLLSGGLAFALLPWVFPALEGRAHLFVGAGFVVGLCGLASLAVTVVQARRRPFLPEEPELSGDSPVPWISKAVWRQRGQLSRAPGLYDADIVSARLGDVDAVSVSAEWRDRAPVARSRLAVQPSRAPASSLEGSPHAGFWWNPGSWPVCCDELTTLVLANPTQAELAPYEAGGALDSSLEEPDVGQDLLEAAREGRSIEQGLNVFQCGRCQRIYSVASFT